VKGTENLMITTLLVVALAAASLLAARRWVRPRHPVSPRDQVDAFTRARAVTSRWSADPATTPAPLQDYLAQQRAAREEGEG
jgi:hypothetical protein